MNSAEIISPKIVSRPSLRGLARELGVSHTTVAMALKDDSRISFALRRRIQDTAGRRGYVLNDTVRNLFSGSSQVVGILAPDLACGAHLHLVDTLIESFREQGRTPYVLLHRREPGREDELLEKLARLRVDGVVMIASPDRGAQASFAEHLKSTTPMIQVCAAASPLKLPIVQPDYANGAADLTIRLVETGAVQVLFIQQMLPCRDALAKESGYRRAIARVGLEQQVLCSHEAGLNELGQLLGGGSLTQDSQATAVLACNEDVTIGVIRMANRLGLNAGRDFPLAAMPETPRPPWLTLFPQVLLASPDWAAIGGEAANSLMHLIDARQGIRLLSEIPLTITEPAPVPAPHTRTGHARS